MAQKEVTHMSSTTNGWYANFRFSIPAGEQAEWQLFLRMMPTKMQQHPTWRLLHDLSYAPEYSEQQEFPAPERSDDESWHEHFRGNHVREAKGGND
jgi:GH25 family lysozyme M1 (1,4-beta-N-acetylmuramidase)